MVYPAMGNTLLLGRGILNDTVFIWLHFGAGPARLENTTGQVLGRIFDSADSRWNGPGSSDGKDILPGQPIEIAPWSVLVFEKK
jgi:hypothetical protein